MTRMTKADKAAKAVILQALYYAAHYGSAIAPTPKGAERVMREVRAIYKPRKKRKR